MKQLTLEMIEACPEIQRWLNQFESLHRESATAILLKLRFVSRDEYSGWLNSQFNDMSDDLVYGLFAVRKMCKSIKSIWDADGKVVGRPGGSQGSEDFVLSIIANRCKHSRGKYIDHPSIAEIKKHKKFCALFIDDSIGSGKRSIDYVRRFINTTGANCHKTILSRWSFGNIRIKFLAYARTKESEQVIVNAIPGSDHGRRKFGKSQKISFVSELCFNQSDLHQRWGAGFSRIVDACDSVSQVNHNWRRGFKGTMSNIVFDHSIPNNIPGALWWQNENWNALFPGRHAPSWLPLLLDNRATGRSSHNMGGISPTILSLLRLVKGGCRSKNGLQFHTGLDNRIISRLVDQATEAGFLSVRGRLTEAGLRVLKNAGFYRYCQKYDYSLYIPTIWCAGRETVQPPGLDGATRQDQADSSRDSSNEDGDVGQASLERTDAKATASPLNVTAHQTSSARKGGDVHGPQGWTER